MKQHITREQLWELVGKQDEVLHKWCKEKGYLTKENSIPLLTIGQMIEFLGDDLDSILRTTKRYTVVLDIGGKGKLNEFTSEELIEALWEAVKYKLND